MVPWGYFGLATMFTVISVLTKWCQNNKQLLSLGGPPITLLKSRLTYHKYAKGSHPYLSHSNRLDD